MAGNKKPKKRYNPNRQRQDPNAHVSYQSAAKVFFPLVNAQADAQRVAAVA